RQAQTAYRGSPVGAGLPHDQLALLGFDAHRRLDGEGRQDLRLPSRGEAVVECGVLVDLALDGVRLGRSVVGLLLARGCGSRASQGLAEIFRLETESLLDELQVAPVHRRVTLGDGEQ